MTLILSLAAVAVAGPSFAIGLALGRWEARGRADQLAPHQALALVYGCDADGWDRP